LKVHAQEITMFQRPFAFPPTLRTAAAAMAAVAAAAGVATPALADCRQVNGHYTEQLVTSAPCSSAVGVCLQGVFSGVVSGSFTTAVDTFVPTPDMPPIGVAQFTAGSIYTVRIGGREGTLAVRNTGAIRFTGAGEIVDLQVIVGGTGGLANASGVITSVGAFSFAAGGRSEYNGAVCVPGAF
jgi:hypothetical protein